MHEIQKQILRLAESRDLNSMSLREIGDLLGLEKNYPQKVKHHLDQLIKKDLIRKNKKITPVISGWDSLQSFFSFPILGRANCGEPTSLAQESLEGYLKVSKGFLASVRPHSNMFAIKAVGHSMNRAKVGSVKSNIEDGDYVLVDADKKSPNNGEYVLSIISGCANIKKFLSDNEHGRIILISESNLDFPPIYIHENDAPEYMVNGIIVGVIKKPSRIED